MRIAVAGGTGTVGRLIVVAAERRGHDVTVLSRRTGADARSGVGLDAALSGVDTVIDALNTTTLSTKSSRAYFASTTSNLLEAERREAVGHHIALSIVGIDAIDTGYYAGKLAQEHLVTTSSIPHTVARASQFHEFAGQIAAQATLGPVTLAPRTLTRPVAGWEVAEHLVDLAEAGPSGRVRDLIGPEETTLASMIRRLYASDGIGKRVVELRLPGAYGAGLASGRLRGSVDHGRIAAETFDAWLTRDHRAARA